MATDPLSLEQVLADFDAGSGGIPRTSGQPLPDLMDDARAEEAGQIGVDPDNTGQVQGKAESAVAGAFDMLSFGFLDEAGAVADTVLGGAGRKTVWSSGRSFAQTYHDNLALNRGALKEASSENPLSFLGGQVVGAIVVPFGSGARGALGLAKVGAVQGGIYGVGSGEGFSDSLTEGVKGAGIGAAVGGVIGKVTSKLGERFGKKAVDAVSGAADEATSVAAKAGEETAEEGVRILGYGRGGVPIAAAPEVPPVAGQVDEIVKLTDAASIGRKELTNLQDDVTKFSTAQATKGERAVDVTWENAPDVVNQTGDWRIGSLGSTEDSKSLIRALAEKLNPTKTVRSDEQLMGSARMFANEIGEGDAEAVLAFAKSVAGELGDADTAMATLRTIWAKSSQEVTDFHLMGVDWANASDELVVEAGQRIYNLSVLSSHVQQAKTGLGRALRVNKLPNAEDYINTLRMGGDELEDAATAAVGPRGMNPLPRTREELSDWYDLWSATGGDPKRQADFLQGILTVPAGGKYLRQSIANFFTASILSAPRTVALNLIGPGTISVIRQAERLTGAAAMSVNPMASAAERASARAVARYSAMAYVKTFSEIGDAFRMALIAAERNHTVVGGGGSTVDSLTAFGPFTDNLLAAAGQKPSTSYTLGNLINVWPKAFARLNNGLDEFSKRLAYQGEVRVNAMVEAGEMGLKGDDFAAFVADKMKSSYDEVGHATDEQLLRSAERTTLTSTPGEPDTLLRKGANSINALRADYPELRFLLPVFNVPVNALVETMRRTPIARIPGVNTYLFNQTARELAGELGPVAQADAHGRTLLAAGFMMAGLQMNRSGMLTGAGPRNPTDRKVWLATHQPYSIRVGDQWVRYDKFDILGGLLSIPATVADMSTYREADADWESQLFSGVGALGQWFRDRAALRNATGLLALGDDPTKDTETIFTQLAGSVASGFYPAALRTLITDGMTNPYTPLRRSWTDFVEAAMPFKFDENGISLGNDVEVMRNVMGEPVEKPLNSVLEALVPISMVKAVGYDTDPVLDELDRLYQNTGYGAGADSKSLSYGFFADKDVKLEDGRSIYTHAMQARQTLEVEGQTMREALTALFDSEEYNAAVDGDSQKKETSKGELSRGYMVAQVFKTYNTAIKQQLASNSDLARAYLTAAAAKRADDAYLREYSVEELVANPALYDAAGVNREGYESDLTGGTGGLLEAFGAQ